VRPVPYGHECARCGRLIVDPDTDLAKLESMAAVVQKKKDKAEEKRKKKAEKRLKVVKGGSGDGTV
jgi:hypothetical protein